MRKSTSSLTFRRGKREKGTVIRVTVPKRREKGQDIVRMKSNRRKRRKCEEQAMLGPEESRMRANGW